MDQKTIYKKTFTRDFTLAVVEIWWRAESINDKQWTEKRQPFSPFIIFERENGVVSSYYHPQGIDWAEKMLVQKMKDDPQFITSLEKNFVERFSILERMYNRETPLSLKELLDFFVLLEEWWVWFEAAWWIWRLEPEKLVDLQIPESFRKIREDTQDLVPKSETIIRKSLNKLFPDLGKLIEVLRIEEIATGLIPDKKILKERDEKYFFTDNTLSTNISREAIEGKFGVVLETFEVSENIRKIKGQVGNTGKVSGRVVIVYGPKEAYKVKQGDIIVSSMTLPDILPAMKKAAAYVTDEGGIACHAAIISRELNKPCIIGTKIATKVLKDGDLVEVDANKGIIKILKNV